MNARKTNQNVTRQWEGRELAVEVTRVADGEMVEEEPRVIRQMGVVVPRALVCGNVDVDDDGTVDGLIGEHDHGLGPSGHGAGGWKL